jgi:hypothetical protein
MPVIPVNKVVDPKRIIGKMEGRGGGEAQGDADPKKNGQVHNLKNHSCQTLSPEVVSLKPEIALPKLKCPQCRQSSRAENRVTRRVCLKIAQNVGRTIFGQNLYITLAMEKKQNKNFGYFSEFQKAAHS